MLITTKWLMLAGLPVWPLGSYLVSPTQAKQRRVTLHLWMTFSNYATLAWILIAGVGVGMLLVLAAVLVDWLARGSD